MRHAVKNAKIRAVDAYINRYGKQPDHVIRAPGRVNIIGEHTDYNDGFVLPCAIDRDTVVAIGKADQRDSANINSYSCDFDDGDNFSIDDKIRPSEKQWANYIRGMAKHLIGAAYHPSPSQMTIAGDVPLGSGLSSSASLEIAVGRALIEQSALSIDPAELALIAQAAENQFIGCSCGIMDQLISAQGQSDHALLIDCRSLQCTPISIPKDTAIIIVNSGVAHSNVDGEYNQRRMQCEAAAHHYGVTALRDIDEAQLIAGKANLDALTYKRARHVVSENARTLAAAEALKLGDMQRLGALMMQSHISMRDDFEITIPAIDELADIMNAIIGGNGGARMTGGGFGGCVIGMTHIDKAPALIDAIYSQYSAPNGKRADIFICKASQGANKIKYP